MYHEHYTLMENARERMKDMQREADRYRLLKKAREGRPSRLTIVRAYLSGILVWVKLGRSKSHQPSLDSHKRATLEVKGLIH